jgi:hypothetical protein
LRVRLVNDLRRREFSALHAKLVVISGVGGNFHD